MKDDAKHSGDVRAASRARRLAEELRANLGKRRAQARVRKKAAPSEADAPTAIQSARGNPRASDP